MMEKTLATRRAFDGNLLSVDVVDVELSDGRRSMREIVRHSKATVVLGELPDGRFVLVRQFRKALEEEMIEAVAGGQEEGESAEECAKREMKEESGYEVVSIDYLGAIVSSPGFCDEVLYAYHARLEAERWEQIPDEDEEVEVLLRSRDEIEKMIVVGEIIDGKTMAAWTLLGLKKLG